MRLILVICALSSAWVVNGQLLRYEGKVSIEECCVIYIEGGMSWKGKWKGNFTAAYFAFGQIG